MVKIALIIALLAFVWFVIVRPLFRVGDSKNTKNAKSNAKHTQIQSEEMRQCDVCGTFCALSEGISQKELFFCQKGCYEKFIESKKQD